MVPFSTRREGIDDDEWQANLLIKGRLIKPVSEGIWLLSETIQYTVYKLHLSNGIPNKSLQISSRKALLNSSLHQTPTQAQFLSLFAWSMLLLPCLQGRNTGSFPKQQPVIKPNTHTTNMRTRKQNILLVMYFCFALYCHTDIFYCILNEVFFHKCSLQRQSDAERGGGSLAAPTSSKFPWRGQCHSPFFRARVHCFCCLFFC